MSNIKRPYHTIDGVKTYVDFSAEDIIFNDSANLQEKYTRITRQPSTAYSSGDIRFCNELPTGWYLQCSTAGTSGSSTITLPSTISTGTTVTDGTARWTIRKIASTSNVPSVSGYQNAYTTSLVYYRVKTDTPAYNTKDWVETSGTYTAPVTGWYFITLKGAGGGGQGGYRTSSAGGTATGGNGGGSGGTSFAYCYMTAGTNCDVVIGAGGTGSSGAAGSTPAFGGEGGSTMVTIGGQTWTAQGAGSARNPDWTNSNGIRAGIGDIYGECGHKGGTETSGYDTYGGHGAGGAKGYFGSNKTAGENGVYGGGGGGGGARNESGYQYVSKGGNGGDGYVWFEYWS